MKLLWKPSSSSSCIWILDECLIQCILTRNAIKSQVLSQMYTFPLATKQLFSFFFSLSEGGWKLGIPINYKKYNWIIIVLDIILDKSSKVFSIHPLDLNLWFSTSVYLRDFHVTKILKKIISKFKKQNMVLKILMPY